MNFQEVTWNFCTDRNPFSLHSESGVVFKGEPDQLVYDHNPLEGARAFKLEALFRQEPKADPEQRFVHIQVDGCDDRVLLETRLGPEGTWYADTFVKIGEAEQVLIDPCALHPCGVWHTLTLYYDGCQLTQLVNGFPEISVPFACGPLGPGKVSLGARLNRVSWFHGAIRHVTFLRSLGC